MPADAKLVPSHDPGRDPSTGRFIAEGDFGPPKYADAPVVDRELGNEDRTAPPPQPPPNPRRFIESDDTQVALRELPAGEVPSERLVQYTEQPQVQEQQVLPPPPAQPDLNPVLLQMMERMLSIQEQVSRPAPPPATPPPPSTLERFKADQNFAKQYAYDISAGRLNVEVPEHSALAYTAAYVADQLEQARAENARQFAELNQFRTQLTQAAQLNQATTQAQEQIKVELKDYTFADSPQAVADLAKQAAPYILQGHQPKDVIKFLVGPTLPFMAKKGTQAPAPQDPRLRQLTPAQQAAMGTVAQQGKGAGKPDSHRPDKSNKNWWREVLATHEKHSDWEGRDS